MGTTVGGADHSRVAAVDTARVGDEFIVMVPAGEEASESHHAALRQAASLGFSLLEEEYWDMELDCAVYVFTRRNEEVG